MFISDKYVFNLYKVCHSKINVSDCVDLYAFSLSSRADITNITFNIGYQRYIGIGYDSRKKL